MPIADRLARQGYESEGAVSDQELECKLCGELISIPLGLDPTEYCNPCAQSEVVRLGALVEELRNDNAANAARKG